MPTQDAEGGEEPVPTTAGRPDGPPVERSESQAAGRPEGPAAERSESPAAFGAREQLSCFVTLWVMALAFHYTDDAPLKALPVLILCVPALVFPSSLLALGGVIAVAAVNAVLTLPAPANHKVLSLFVALGFAGAALWLAVTRRRSGLGGEGAADRRTFGERWLETARTPAALSLMVIYVFTVFDKVNTAFLDPATSCAGGLLGQLFGLNGVEGFVPPRGLVQASAFGTLVVETSILVCLVVPGLRRWGVPLGVGFHLFLAPASFWDFSTMVFAVYVLLLPAPVFARLAPRAGGRRQAALIAFGVHMMLSMTVLLSRTSHTPFGLPWHTLLALTWFAAVLPIMVPLVWASFTYRAGRPAAGRPGAGGPDAGPPDAGAGAGGRVGFPGWRFCAALLLVVPLLAFVNGASPYLGLKTVGVYSMFSNLHTEQGATNHLIPGLQALSVMPYQRDTVTITGVTMNDATEDKAPTTDWLQEKPPVTVPLLEVRRVVGLWRADGLSGIRVEYVRDGQPKVAADALTDPVLGRPLAWWQQHLLAFRAIDSGEGRNICRW